MALLVWAAVLTGWCVSIAGAIQLCRVIERHNQAEAYRELFGISPGDSFWR